MTIPVPSSKEILKHLGFKDFNSIQKEMILAAEKDQNIMLVAPTGSGKTVGFIMAVLNNVKPGRGVQVLILAPTRELVLQIEQVLRQMKLNLKVNACYGGHPFKIERNNFSTPPEILVGTPGRIEDHIKRETFNPETITQLIFDEFDKSLEYGFTSQMEAIVSHLSKIERQILVSATQSLDVPSYLNFNKPHLINATKIDKPDIALKQLIVPKDEKFEGLLQLLSQLKENENAIVFVNHRDASERICDYLDRFNAAYAIFHGGLKQTTRELELMKFRNGSAQFLIATDIAARGIDIPELDFVIHYQMPINESAFIHRNGRTARMKSTGTSILIQTDGDALPDYLKEEPEIIPNQEIQGLIEPEWVTFYIGKGKKDKVNKIDLVGYFLQFDFMTKSDLGLIEIKDYSAYIAIKRKNAQRLLKASQTKKIKNRTTKIQLVK